jgi:hypothetical protein
MHPEGGVPSHPKLPHGPCPLLLDKLPTISAFVSPQQPEMPVLPGTTPELPAMPDVPLNTSVLSLVGQRMCIPFPHSRALPEPSSPSRAVILPWEQVCVLSERERAGPARSQPLIRWTASSPELIVRARGHEMPVPLRCLTH